MPRYYFDHAATTSVDPRVLKKMLPFFSRVYGNPSALYGLGRETARAMDEARKTMAKILECSPTEIFFTSGGTESDNLAILGAARGNGGPEKHIITTKIEHHAVLRACEQLEKEGVEVTYLPVDKDGFVTAEQVLRALKPQTVLVTIMYGNNEIGVIEPIAEIGRALLKYNAAERARSQPVLFHTDACQAAGALELRAARLHVDLLTLNGSKIYGPKGAGILYKKRGVNLQPLFYGGEQEFGLRPGTENTAAIAGLAAALQLAQDKRVKENKRLIGLRDYLWKKIQEKIPKVKLNGPTLDETDALELRRLPNNLNFTVFDIEGEAMLLYLDELGIQAATGSACTSQSLEPSHVILALGSPYEYAHGSLRLTLGRSNNKQQIDYLIKVLPEVVKKLREISPVSLSGEGKESHPQYKK